MDSQEVLQVQTSPPPSPLTTPSDDSINLPPSDLSTVQDYIEARNSWQFSKPIPNFSYLGDVSDSIIHTRFPPKPRSSFPAGPHYFPLKICILGSQFSGRHTNSKALELKYGLKVFEIEKVLEDRNRVLERKQELEEGKKPKKTQEDESEAFIEESVNSPGDSSKEKARLLRAKLRGLFGDEPKVEEEQKKNTKKEEVKCQGFVVIGYPKTAEEAEDLELELAGFIDPKRLPPSTGSVKKEESWIIATPSGRTSRKQVLQKSFFDLIFKLEVSSHILVKRAVDRRVDASGNVYNLTFNPPPDNLLPKLKPIESPNEEEILRNFEEFNSEKVGLNNWLQRFGIKRWSSFVQITETKLDLVKENIEKKVQEWLKIREELANKQETFEVSLEFHDKENSVSVKDVKKLYSMWVELKNSYLVDLSQVLARISTISNDLVSARENIFLKFESFLCRDDHKQLLIDPFIERLASLLESRTIITSKSRKNMLEELDNLSDQLWDIIEGRKEENLKYLEKLISQDPCLELMTSVLTSIKDLVNIEITRLGRSFNLITAFHKVLNLNSQEIAVPLVDVQVQLDSPDSGEDKLNEVIFKARESVKGLNGDIQIEASLQFLLRLEQIQNWGKKNLAEIVCSSKDIFVVLDKWIGDAIKAENDAANVLVNAWKESVKDRRLSSVRKIRENSEIKNYLTRDL